MKVLVFDLLACGANLDHLKGGGPELPCRWRSGNFPGCDTANVAVPERISRPLGSSLRETCCRGTEGSNPSPSSGESVKIQYSNRPP